MEYESQGDVDLMADEIAAAESAPELSWLRSEVARRFPAHVRRPALERMIDEMLVLLRDRAQHPRGMSRDSRPHPNPR